MNYMDYLRSNHEIIQKQIEDLIAENKAQPVGSGFIDIIISFRNIKSLIKELSKIGIAINGVSWWCLYSEENKNHFGCPHGIGGPQSVHYEGWFSEIGIDNESYDLPEKEYENLEHGTVMSNEINAYNEAAWKYIREFAESKRFIACLNPALWLHVPQEWKRVSM